MVKAIMCVKVITMPSMKSKIKNWNLRMKLRTFMK